MGLKKKTIHVGNKTHTWNPSEKKTAHVVSTYKKTTNNGKKSVVKKTKVTTNGKTYKNVKKT